jgi:hypothetical protein
MAYSIGVRDVTKRQIEPFTRKTCLELTSLSQLSRFAPVARRKSLVPNLTKVQLKKAGLIPTVRPVRGTGMQKGRVYGSRP